MQEAEKGQPPAMEIVLRWAAKRRSHGEGACALFHVLNTVLAVDTHGNGQYEQHTRHAECHPVQVCVLVGRVGDPQDSAECHLIVL